MLKEVFLLNPQDISNGSLSHWLPPQLSKKGFTFHGIQQYPCSILRRFSFDRLSTRLCRGSERWGQVPNALSFDLYILSQRNNVTNSSWIPRLSCRKSLFNHRTVRILHNSYYILCFHYKCTIFMLYYGLNSSLWLILVKSISVSIKGGWIIIISIFQVLSKAVSSWESN